MILVVEDNEDLLDVLRWVLESARYTVATAANGEDALVCIRAAPRPRLVLLDITLPDMSGLEVAARMKADPALAEIPIVLVSGMPFIQTGGIPMLLKPVAPDDLLVAVRRYAGRASELSEIEHLPP